jgi:hypothetical protein
VGRQSLARVLELLEQQPFVLSGLGIQRQLSVVGTWFAFWSTAREIRP